MLKKKNWEIQDGFKYKLSNCLVTFFTLSPLFIILGIFNNNIWDIIGGVIFGIVGGIGTGVDYIIKKKKYLRPKPQTTVEVKTDLLGKE